MFWGTLAEIVPSLIAAGLLAGYRPWGDHRYAQGRFDEQIEQHQRQIRRNRARSPYAGRHAVAAPLQTPATSTSRPARLPDVPVDYWPSLYGPAHQRQRVVTTAADLSPVIVPRPGTSVPLRAQPAPNPGPDTRAMRKLTDTGEMRALTDEYIREMRARGETYRQETFK